MDDITQNYIGKQCHLLKPTRLANGMSKFKDIATILRVVRNLEREMFLVRFTDDTTTFLFPEEFTIIEDEGGTSQ
jgi:hypothetical protein